MAKWPSFRTKQIIAGHRKRLPSLSRNVFSRFIAIIYPLVCQVSLRGIVNNQPCCLQKQLDIIWIPVRRQKQCLSLEYVHVIMKTTVNPMLNSNGIFKESDPSLNRKHSCYLGTTRSARMIPKCTPTSTLCSKYKIIGAALKCAPIMEWEFILASGRSSF